MDNEKIEIDSQTLAELFKAAGKDVPEHITNDDIRSLVGNIKKPAAMTFSEMMPIENENDFENNILIVDDIGVVTYQLKILFQNIGYNVHTTRDIFSGLNAFVKSNYKYVIMDLFVSTEQEGFTLLNEIKRNIEKNNLNTKIVIITASNKAENKIKCLNSGADIYLRKEAGWQDRLVEIISHNINE